MVVHPEMLARLSLHSGPLSQILEDDPTGKDLKGKAQSVLYVLSTSLHFSFTSLSLLFHFSYILVCNVFYGFLSELNIPSRKWVRYCFLFFFPVASVTFICVDQRRCFISKGSHCNWRVS